MELDRNKQKLYKKSKKIEVEPPEKKVKTDTPCKKVDAKYLMLEKKLQSYGDINKLNQIKKKLNNKDHFFNNLNNVKKKKIDLSEKFNKTNSALTEREKEKNCDYKMTKVVVPVVKMVEPLFELIDFEEEIKVEKISKEECKTTDINMDYDYSDEEMKIEKNIIKKTSKNENQMVKNFLNMVVSETNSNSNDSYWSENSNKSAKSDISRNKSIAPRLSRRGSRKGEVSTKSISDQQSAKKENKKSFIIKKITKNNNNAKQKILDLPLTKKHCIQNNITSSLVNDTIPKINENLPNTLSYVPTVTNDKEPSSTSEQYLNTDINKNLEILEQPDVDNLKNCNIENYKILEPESKLESEISQNDDGLQEVNDLEKLTDATKENVQTEVCDENFNIINTQKQQENNLETELNTVIEHKSSHSQNMMKFEKEINILPEQLEEESDNILHNKVEENSAAEINSNLNNEIELKVVTELDKIGSNIEEPNPKQTNIIETAVEKDEQVLSFEHDDTVDCISKVEVTEVINEPNNLTENISQQQILSENEIVNTRKEIETSFVQDTETIDAKENVPENKDDSEIEAVQGSEERFFIFGDEIEEENSACEIAIKNSGLASVNKRICGEIIHKENFSINCYMCWDNENWTFKKFNDLKLFSIHLNTQHSNDQICFQNSRGNSYTLDFVNENSCVMPQPMWCEIYKEIISFKCGLAKIDLNGFIHYSCLECQHDFKNFNTFIKHVLGKETKNEEHEISKTKESYVELHLINEKLENSLHNEDINSKENLEEDSKNYDNNSKNTDIENISDTKIKNEIDIKNSIEDCLPKPKGILESILEAGKTHTESIENVKMQSNKDIDNAAVKENFSTTKPENRSEESIITTTLICEAKDNSKIEKKEEEYVPDAYGYKNIVAALFDIFDNGTENSVNSKLTKILSLGQSYRNIKEKEKQDSEEKEKLKILSLSLQRDVRPKLNGVNILTRNYPESGKSISLLTCTYCNRPYTCLTNLREHFRIHIGDRMVICYECKRGFSKKSTLEEHIKIFHVDPLYKDIDLDTLGDNRKEIARNTKITMNEKNPKEKGFKCNYCPRFLTNRAILEEHLRLHFGEKPLKCSKCSLEFLKKSVYDKHLHEIHILEGSNNRLVNFETNSCDKENNKAFSNKRKIQKSNFKCKQCPNTFPTKIGLIEHLLMNHNDGEFKCSFCEHRFSTKKKRYYHEKLHKNGPTFQCNFCDQRFPNFFTLEQHENSHKKNADYKCRFCNHYFASDKTRALHEEMHETTGNINENLKIQTIDVATILQMNNEQNPMSSNGNANDSNGTSSDTTDRSSNQNTASRNLMVKKIIKKIKRGKRDPNSPLDCRYCKKHFESPHQLSYHERLHEIGKKFQCNICDKIMATSYALELHLTAHLKRKNFSKNLVGNKFNGSALLPNQLTIHAKVQPDLKPKIEIVSDVTLAPTETMEILNGFFKRDIPTITVTTTSEDGSFQKIGVDDIEKNLTAHVLRDTDPYYQLMADFSYQYQMYQTKCIPQMETDSYAECSLDNFEDKEYNDISDQRPKKGRRRKTYTAKTENAIDSNNSNFDYTNQQKDSKIQQLKTSTDNHLQESLQNNIIQSIQNDSSELSKESIKKNQKKKNSPDNNKNVANVFIKCEYCNKKFNSNDKKLLSRHRRLHIAGDTHKCSFCNKCFATLYYLDRHLKVHHLNDVVELKCTSCDSIYVLAEALRRHQQRAHKEHRSDSRSTIENNKEDAKNQSNSINTHSTESNAEEITDKLADHFKDQEFAIPEIPNKSKKRSRSKELKLFDCDFCEKAFLTLNSLQLHIDKIHKRDVENFESTYKIKCTYEDCKKKFDCQTNLEKHLRLHESGFKCSICGKKTMSQNILDHHMKSHGLPTSFECKYCTSKFTMQLSRELHERKIHFKGSINVHPRLIIKKLRMCKRKVSYRCFNCKKSFSSLILLKTHTMYKHPVYECNTCPAMFSKINELEEHEKIHLKTLQCNLCDKTFENKHTLYKHRRQHETKFFKCNMCPAEFSFRDELNEHKKNHDESERPFKCVEMGCDKAFVVETFLNTHLKKIHGYFLFNCDRCKREFLNEDLLIAHRKEHDLLPVDKQYRCDQCFKDFSTPTILKIHQKLHQSSVVAAAADSQTPDPQKTSKLKLYTCEQCDKRFSIVTYLNNHLKKVHQVKLFVCENCKMEFRNEKDLQEHSKVHLTGKKFIRVEKTHLDRPFKCELCGNSYAILAYLNNHLNKAHGNEEISNEVDSKNLKENHFNTNRKEVHSIKQSNESLKILNNDQDHLNPNAENSAEQSTSKENDQDITKLPLIAQNSKKNNSIKCDHCYLRFISSKYLKEHSKMHLDPNDSSRIEMLENSFNPQRSEKILKPVISSSRSSSNNNNSQLHQQKIKTKKVNFPKNKKKPKKQPKLKLKTYDEDSSSSVELIEVCEPPDIPEHNLSYTQITEALTSASSGLTAIQPVEVIETPNDDDQQMTTELTPLTTLTSLTSLTPLTPLQPTAVFHHPTTDRGALQSHQQQSQIQISNTPVQLASLEPSTISEATKLSLTLLEPSAFCELTALTEPSVVPIHTTSLTDLTSAYDHSTGILHHDHTMLGDLASSSTTATFDAQVITTQCNASSTMLNTSSASSDYAVTNMDTSQITQQSKKPRISDSNMHLESLAMLDDSSSQAEQKSQSELTNFSTFDSTMPYLSTKTDQNMSFTDLNLSAKSIISDSTSLEPLTYSDSMPLSEATTILELTSSSQPTSSSEATALSESNNVPIVQNPVVKKKRNSGKKSLRGRKPNDDEITNLEGDFDTCSDTNNFKCTLCRRVYDSWIKFRKHNEYHNLRPHQCSVCPCNFKTGEELSEHSKAHASNVKNFSCEVCNRVFISKSRLKAHMLTVHNEEREFKCEYCASAFKTKSRLVDHTRCHTGEKPIKCHYCDEHFSRAAYRLKHERAAHPKLLEIDIKTKEEKMKKKNSANEK